MPQQIVFSLDTFYDLRNDGSEILLDVIIGDEGQSPDYNVRLNTKKLLEHVKESIKNFLVGIDKEINGKALRINGNIVDTSKVSDKIELTIKLKGGISDFLKKFSVTVEEEGEIVVFSIVLRLVS